MAKNDGLTAEERARNQAIADAARKKLLEKRTLEIEAEKIAAKHAQVKAEKKVQDFIGEHQVGHILLKAILKAEGNLKDDPQNRTGHIPLNGQSYSGHTPAVTISSRFKIGEYWYPGYKYVSVLGGVLPTIMLSATVCQDKNDKLYWLVVLTIEDGLNHGQKNHVFVYPGVDLAGKLAELIPVKSKLEEAFRAATANTKQKPEAFKLDFDSIENELERNRKK